MAVDLIFLRARLRAAVVVSRARRSRHGELQLADNTIPDHRNRRTNAYARALARLWQRYGDGSLTEHGFTQASDSLIRRALGYVERRYAREHGIAGHTFALKVAALRATAQARLRLAAHAGLGMFRLAEEDDAMEMAVRAIGQYIGTSYPTVKAPPSDAQVNARADRAAGALWGYHAAMDGAAEAADAPEDADGKSLVAYWNSAGDENVCPDCAELDAGSPYSQDDLPGEPGNADTACDGMCRCDLVWAWE